MRETAFAKLNLALHVRERRPDGYHRIETIFAFCEHGDELEASPSDDISVQVSGPMRDALAGEGLVGEAARLLRKERPDRGGAILRLEKCLPVAAGLGGGSADAAAALRLLDRLWGLDLEAVRLATIGRALGADVPACVYSRPMRGEGKGDDLSPRELPELEGKPVLLVNPGAPLPTADVFRRWDGKDRGPLGEDWRGGRNDLQPAARSLVPAINDVLAAFAGAEIARMSGSGATCFGLFASLSARDEAARRIARDFPSWWLLPTRLRAD